MLNNLAGYLEHKNYFIISSVKDDVLRRSEINQKRIVCPYLAEAGSEPVIMLAKKLLKMKKVQKMVMTVFLVIRV